MKDLVKRKRKNVFAELKFSKGTREYYIRKIVKKKHIADLKYYFEKFRKFNYDKMLKTKIFEITPKGCDTEINRWLEENQNIDVISTNSFANGAGWGYIILYKEI